ARDERPTSSSAAGCRTNSSTWPSRRRSSWPAAELACHSASARTTEPPSSYVANGSRGQTPGKCRTMIRGMYFSDAHIENQQSDESHPWSETRPLGFGPDLRPFVGTVDLLVLAGDIGRIHSTRNVSPLSYAEALLHEVSRAGGAVQSPLTYATL